MKRFVALTVAVVLMAGMGLLNLNCGQRLTDERLQEMKDAKKAVETAKEEAAPAAATPAPAAVTPAPAPAPTAAPAAVAPGEWPAEAPATFLVQLATSKGDVVVECHKDWAPVGAQHFYDLVKAGFFNGVKFFRVVKEPRPFVVQFGIAADPAVQAKLGEETLQDDPPKQSNTRGMVVYAATQMPNSRSTQLFINLGENQQLDRMGFAPFGKVVKGMEVADSFNGQYGDAPTKMQFEIKSGGNAYLDENFPGLDYIDKATLIPAAQQ